MINGLLLGLLVALLGVLALIVTGIVGGIFRWLAHDSDEDAAGWLMLIAFMIISSGVYGYVQGW